MGWHQLSFRRRLEEVDLKGGGAGDRVTARKRQENQLLLLANQIASLAEQVRIHARRRRSRKQSRLIRPENSAQQRPSFEGLVKPFCAGHKQEQSHQRTKVGKNCNRF